jgi:hypothetical protein
MMKSSEKMSVSAWIDLMSGEFLHSLGESWKGDVSLRRKRYG